ncbi:MAG: ABC transporter substrate-binding protein [Alphaproteobacteria bacterium]|nr:ABC transporter substrate-binding protein [Alphaproteobacteria bacterium]
MIKKIKISLVCLLLSSPANAEGLAMVGTPQMPSDFTHFNYANPEALKGGVFRRAAFGTFDTLNPFSLKGNSAQGLNLAYDRLMARSWDEPFTMYPMIAESVEIPEDRSSITFTLNPAARFQDGTPITTDDVQFSFETLKEKGRPNMRNVYKLIKSVKKTDPQKITFILGKGYDRETVMILSMMPVLSKAWWKDKDFNKTTLEIPNTSGPYRITEISAGRKIVYERDPNYWGVDLPVNKGQYNFGKISFDYFRDQTAAFESFKAGELDVWVDTDPGHWMSAYNLPSVTSGMIKKEEIKHGRVERIWGFIFNTRRPPFDNDKVRRALSLMIDYDWINRNIFHDQYKVTTSYFPNSELAATELPDPEELVVLNLYKANLPSEVFGTAWQAPPSGSMVANRANQINADTLLKKAGWVIRNGLRVNEQTGEPFSFEILLSSAEDEKLAISLKKSLERLGITVTPRTLDAAAFQDLLTSYDYDMTLHFWQNTLSPGTEQSLYWGCAAAKMQGSFNYAGICNPAIEDLVAKIPNAPTRETMVSLTRSLDRILTWENYTIPLFYSDHDNVSYWTPVTHPETPSLYGNIMESWWSTHPEAEISE